MRLISTVIGICLVIPWMFAGPATADDQPLEEFEDPWVRAGRIKPWKGDLDGMLERGYIRLLTVPNRTHFFVDGARERGVVAEAASELEKQINSQTESKRWINVVTIPVNRDQLIPYLNRGLGDIAAANLTITAERLESVDFSVPMAEDVRELVILAPGEPLATTEQALSGREIWVRQSSSYHESLVALNQRLTAAGQAPVDIHLADEALEDEEILEMVNAGLYPATVVDSHKLEWVWARVFEDLQITDIALRDSGEIAAAVRKDSPQLLAMLNDFLSAHRLGTAYGDKLVNRYLKNSRWIGNTNATEDRQRFDAVIDFFRQYAEQYDFDYLMMVAQGYQESRLDQGAVSPVGAIGIMQLMPETAAGHPLYLDDVSEAKVNIEAGIKYMRHIVDQYFTDPEIDEANRHLFAFAAYNAGPNRIARLRETAPEKGLDPNLWFGNVQHIVAAKVGQEPVRYVDNIFKYYLAYRRVEELGQASSTR